MKWNYFLTLIYLIACINLSAQNQTASSSKELIAQLKEGALIVRIYMNKPKAELLKKAIEGENDKGKRVKLEKMLNSHESDRSNYKQRVIDAFRINYNFSKLYFIHDYDVKRLNNGEKAGIFLDEYGNYDPNINLDVSKYFIAGRGENDNVFVILDESSNKLPSDFPARFDRNIIQGLKIALSSNKLQDYVQHLNQNLTRYYIKVN